MGKLCILVLCLAAFSLAISGQTNRRRSVPKKPLPTATPTASAPLPGPTTTATPTPKKNERPAAASNGGTNPAVNRTAEPAYIYEFAQPEFVVSKIRIEHDEQGRGTITFLKMGLDEPESDPIMLSAVTLDRINSALLALDFLNSAVDYQYSKDYSHLGNISFTHQKAGRQRTAKYNWTENEYARVIADEYRKISNQYVWQFDMSIARENQPLNAPSLVDVLDSYLRRNEISDPIQMLPLLREIANDERIPLIARNHAGKLADKIEKQKVKK